MIQSTSITGARAWQPLGPGHPQPAIIDGDLILNVRHVWDVEALADRGLVDQWATGIGFSLDGIDAWKALMVVLVRVIFEDVIGDGPRPAEMPDYSVRINGSFAAALIVDAFDGPFEGSEDWRSAVNRRLCCGN